jgi:hypothetical protein
LLIFAFASDPLAVCGDFGPEEKAEFTRTASEILRPARNEPKIRVGVDLRIGLTGDVVD